MIKELNPYIKTIEYNPFSLEEKEKLKITYSKEPIFNNNLHFKKNRS